MEIIMIVQVQDHHQVMVMGARAQLGPALPAR